MEDKGPPLRPFDYRSVRRMVFALLAIASAHGLFSVISYNRLPGRIPIHFDARGAADAFAGAGISSWFLLFFVSTALGLLLVMVALGIDRFPVKYLSIPRREEFLNLPSQRRSRVFGVLAFHMLVLACIMMSVMIFLHVSIALAAHGVIERLPIAWMVVGVVSCTAEVVVMTLHLLKVIGREIDEHSRLPAHQRTGIL